MTNEELIEALTTLKEQARDYGNNTFIWSINIDSFKFVIDSTIKALEQEPTTNNDLGVETTTMIDKSNFSQAQYKADLQSAYDCGYAQAKNDLGVDCVSRILVQSAISKSIEYKENPHQLYKRIERLPSVTPQEPRCKDCKWWKDSDGAYRRGVKAESQCPINRREVFEGNGYCYMFLPKADMREVKE